MLFTEGLYQENILSSILNFAILAQLTQNFKDLKILT